MKDIERFNLYWLCYAMTAPVNSDERYYFDGETKQLFYSKNTQSGLELFNMVDLSLTGLEAKELTRRLNLIDCESSEILDIPRLNIQDKISIQLLFLSNFAGIAHEEQLRLAVEGQPDTYGFILDNVTTQYDLLEPIAPYWEDFKLKTIQYYLEKYTGLVGISSKIT